MAKKNTYGKLHGNGYWLLAKTYEQAKEHIAYWGESTQAYVKETLSRKDRVIAINQHGGYHVGNISDYSDIVEAEFYPDA